MSKPRLAVWFSCGAASAVTAKLCLEQMADTHEIAIARCIVANEHPDNDRFCADCERWFGQEIIRLRSRFFRTCEDVWRLHNFILSGKGASPCTKKMKKAVRKDFELQYNPDVQAFGFTLEERERATFFRKHNPKVQLLTPLIDTYLTKPDCLHMIQKAGIDLPQMYKLGFNNNNCIGCPKGGKGYWNRIRTHFPDVFNRMAALEREINATVFKKDGEKYFLDQLRPDEGRHDEPKIDCSLFCWSESEEMEAGRGVRA